MTTCASCDSALPDGARFCPACGHEVAPPAVEERRVVTVVFADLVGYTALSEHLDPERVKRLIDASFERAVSPREVSTMGVSPARITPAQVAPDCVVSVL